MTLTTFEGWRPGPYWAEVGAMPRGILATHDQNDPGDPLMKSRQLCIAVAALLSAITVGPAGAQGRGGIPVPALPDQPWEYQTANAKIRVRVLTAGLENPWSLEFLPDASILITERNGRLRHFKDGVLSGPVPGLPAVVSDNFISGLHDIKLHPDFARNRLVYWVYNKGDAPA